MTELSFLPEKVKIEVKKQVDEIYVVFRCDSEQELLAENLMNLLMVIAGITNSSLEKEDVFNPSKNWQNSGYFDEESGKLYFRPGETQIILSHFNLLNINRF
jgi:hypothetical protein